MIFSILRFSNIVQTIHQWKYDLFSIHMMHTSQYHKNDWFCAPGSRIFEVSTASTTLSIIIKEERLPGPLVIFITGGRIFGKLH